MRTDNIPRVLIPWFVLSSSGAGLSLAMDPQPLPVSKGVYRLPFADGTDITFVNDHTNHPAALNRIDIAGQGSTAYTVVAAAAGWIRVISENNDTKCPDACGPNNDCNGDGVTTAQENQQAQQIACGSYAGPSTFCCEKDFEANGGICPGSGTCQPVPNNCATNVPNNFVWIEHSNGEWTKYTHMRRGSVGQGMDNNGNPGAGRFVGEYVGAGTPLGIESDVGLASGPHVHFEVAAPDYVENGTAADFFCQGFLVNDGVSDDVDGDGTDDVNRQNRIPVFCQVGFATAGGTATAGPCNDVCDDAQSDLSGVTIASGSIFYDQDPYTISHPNGDFVVRANSGASVRAVNRVTLSPGFHAEPGSCFSASIGLCDSPGGTGE